MTPLEEQVEKVARELNLEAGRQRGLSDVDDWDYITEQERGGWRNMAKTAIAVLLPLEVTDGEARITDEMVEAGAKGMWDSSNSRRDEPHRLGPWTGLRNGLEDECRSLARACLSAALTQPQAEQWHENDEADKAATAAGVADADLEAAAMEISVKATRLDPETYKVPDKLIWMLRSALFPNEDMERIKSPGPYAKAFRGRFPVPEFPGIKNRQEDQA